MENDFSYGWNLPLFCPGAIYAYDQHVARGEDVHPLFEV